MDRLIVITLIAFASISYGEEKSKSSEEIQLYNKVPKSLFLIKKAKINSDVGEPVVNFKERQLGLVNYDARFDQD